MFDVDTVSMLHETTEPGVITSNLLISLVINQGPKNEACRLNFQDGIELNKVQEIRIEFLNILNIDHLWPLKNLVKLTLSHNIIEKIRNLDELIHLKELDLSFNHIRVMENLNNLSQLEILLLYSNEISIIQGIDNLKKLIILNIGKNKITDWKHITYLRNFKTLKSLNTYENPCTEMHGYLDYLLAFLPQLLYYQYRMISENAQQSATNKHYHIINNLKEHEAKAQMELALQQELDEKIASLSKAYVEHFDQDYFFQQMFLLDEEGKTLSTINEDTQNAFEEYKKSFSIICKELHKLGLQEYNKRMEEIKLFEICVNEGKNNIQIKARRILDEVLERKMEIFGNIKNVTKNLIEGIEADVADEIVTKIRKLFSEFNGLLSRARIELISKEVILHDQIEDINEVFKINMTDMVGSFIETARGYFAQLRNAEADYNDIINGLVLYYLSGFRDEAKIPTHLSSLCGNKDILANTLSASHNTHLQMIDDQEERLINCLNNWLKEQVNQLVVDEKRRNRQQMLEISLFSTFQQQDFNTLALSQQLELVDDDATLDN